MHAVEYRWNFPYREDEQGRLYPGLGIEIVNPENGQSSYIDACIDTGASLSLIDGQLARALGFEEPRRTERFQSSTGARTEGNVHLVVIRHDHFEAFQMELTFSKDAIMRNLVGRDFLRFFHAGFHEHGSELYLTPSGAERA